MMQYEPTQYGMSFPDGIMSVLPPQSQQGINPHFPSHNLSQHKVNHSDITPKPKPKKEKPEGTTRRRFLRDVTTATAAGIAAAFFYPGRLSVPADYTSSEISELASYFLNQKIKTPKERLEEGIKIAEQAVAQRKIDKEIADSFSSVRKYAQCLQKYPLRTFEILGERWIARNQRFLPLSVLEKTLDENRELIPPTKEIFNGFPPYTPWLGFVEAHMQTDAVSDKGAVGPYQLIHNTTISVGGIIDKKAGYDERKHPLLAGELARRILEDNFKRTGNRDIALANYNSGALPHRYLTNGNWKRYGDKISLEGYLTSLGELLEQAPINRNIIQENIYFMLKTIVGFPTIIKKHFPDIYHLPAAEPNSEIHLVDRREIGQHKVASRENLWKIAGSYFPNATPQFIKNYIPEIMRYNRMTTTTIHKGEKIKLPALRNAIDIAGSEGSSQETLAELNPHIRRYDAALPYNAKVFLPKAA
ncbi:MAG: lytic transglycosylase [archaeon]